MAGAKVKMASSKVKSQCLSTPEHNMLATCYAGGKLVGHVFATSWSFGHGQIGWVTQLVRPYHIAFGLVSSHPAACKALAKLTRTDLSAIDVEFIQQRAKHILESTPIEYLKSAELHGSLFEHKPADASVVSSVFTQFYVDHDEPLQALKEYEGQWPLGSLLDGHEFFVVVKVNTDMTSRVSTLRIHSALFWNPLLLSIDGEEEAEVVHSEDAVMIEEKFKRLGWRDEEICDVLLLVENVCIVRSD
ncbi:hypothetical protein PAXINDRAFT_17716 [Paxillus involutus ATCC 200175]|uniref:Uncharacterized protein n=1 Tax=Paxillus involutus ATCC 200175 TaxID=664439 RepID=A0A0C9TE27_PAXIN|nr:hypothetical protein PAXINDRAFT_17716 [Paxillus involutus ATCC 200175]